MTAKRLAVTVALTAAYLPLVAPAQQTSGEVAADRAHRDTAIHWPAAFDPSVAPVFSHNELLLHTDCHRAFTYLADTPHWPDWFLLTKDVSIEKDVSVEKAVSIEKDVSVEKAVSIEKDVSIQGTPADKAQPVHNGTLLRLRIFNSPIQSRIVEFVPDSRISWVPFGSDETETRHGHYHAWHFVPEAAGCLVITEETGIGPGDLKDPSAGSHVMHRAHALWLASLQWVAEP